MKVLVAFLFVIVAVSARTPRFEQCARYPVARVSVTSFPNPLYLRPGSNFHAEFKTHFSRQLPDRIWVNVELKKKVFFLWVKVPCTNNFGSCEYEVTCEKLRQWSGKDKLDEPCPPTTGESHRVINYPIPTISRSVLNQAEGTFSIKVTMRTQPRGRGQLLGCVKTDIQVRK